MNRLRETRDRDVGGTGRWLIATVAVVHFFMRLLVPGSKKKASGLMENMPPMIIELLSI